jgi:hypothetical protein
MGYNIGLRLIEEFLAKSAATMPSQQCTNFRETAEVISKVRLSIGRGEIQ